MTKDEVMPVRDLIKVLEKVKDKNIPVVVDGDDGKYSLKGCVYDALELEGEFIIQFESGEPTEVEEEDDSVAIGIDLAYDEWRDEQLYGEKM